MARGKISLNSVGYEITSFSLPDREERLVHRETLDPFPETFATIGQQRADQVRQINRTNFGPWVGGFGRDFIPDPGDADAFTRFWDSTADTRWLTGARLAIADQDSSHTGLEVLRVARDYKSNYWGLWEDNTSQDLVARSFEASGSVWSGGGNIATGTTGVALDLIVFGDSMVALVATGNDQYAYYSTDGATWAKVADPNNITLNLLTNVVTAHEDIDAGLLAVIGGEIVAIVWHEASGVITFFTATSASGNWTDETTNIASGNGPQGVAVYPGLDGADKLYVGTREGLYEVDTSGTYTAQLIFPLPAHNDNCRRMTVGSDGALWFAQGTDNNGIPNVYRMTVNGDARNFEVVPNNLADSHGLPSDMLGPVRWLESFGGFMYAAVGGGTVGSSTGRKARILCHNGLGWHHMHQNGTADQPIDFLGASGEDDGTPRLHFGVRTAAATTDAKFLADPSTNPASGTTIYREASSYVYAPFDDGGMPNDNSTWIRVAVNSPNLSASTAGEYVNIDYGTEGTARGSFTDLFDAVSGTKSSTLASGAGVSSPAFATHANLLRDSTAVAVDATSTDNTSAATSITVSHTCSGSNRLLVVGVSTYDPTTGAGVPTGVTYNSVAMTKAGDIEQGGAGGSNTDYVVASLWYLVAPATGANDIVASFSEAITNIVLGGVSFTGVDQSSPVGTADTDSGGGTTSFTTTPAGGTLDGLWVDCVAFDGTGTTPTLTAGTEFQTERWDSGDIGVLIGAGSTSSAYATSTTMSWTKSDTKEHASVSMAVNSAVGSSDSPTLRSIQQRYLKRLSRPERWQIKVDIEETARATQLSNETVISNLESAESSVTLVPFTYGPIGTKYVDVQVDWIEQLRSTGYAAGDTTSIRYGYAMLTLTEAEG